MSYSTLVMFIRIIQLHLNRSVEMRQAAVWTETMYSNSSKSSSYISVELSNPEGFDSSHLHISSDLLLGDKEFIQIFGAIQVTIYTSLNKCKSIQAHSPCNR